jgi:hypothetical protein
MLSPISAGCAETGGMQFIAPAPKQDDIELF